MRDIILAAFLFGSIPFILWRPAIGVFLWLWISYMNPHRLTWGFAYDYPFAMIVGVATAVGWLLSREPKRLPGTTITALLVAFALWISLTTLFALAPDLAFPKWDRTIKILLGAFLTLGVMQG